MSASRANLIRIGSLLVMAGLWPGASLPGDLDDFARAFEKNQSLLRGYTWISRTEVTLDGQPQGSERFQVRLAEDGSQDRTPIDTGGKRPSRKQEKQQAQLRESLLELTGSYLAPSRETTRQIFADAFIWRGEDRNEGLTRVQARHVLRQGDQVSLWLDPRTAEPRRIEILSSSGGEPVRLLTRFERIEGGPFYPAHVVLETEIKEKKLVMTTENGEYRRLDP